MELKPVKEREEKAQSYLKSSKREACLITEDGTIFNVEGEHYAKEWAFKLRAGEGFKGDVLTVKVAAKPAPKAKAAKS